MKMGWSQAWRTVEPSTFTISQKSTQFFRVMAMHKGALWKVRCKDSKSSWQALRKSHSLWAGTAKKEGCFARLRWSKFVFGMLRSKAYLKLFTKMRISSRSMMSSSQVIKPMVETWCFRHQMMLISRSGTCVNLQKHLLWLAKELKTASHFVSGSSILWMSICLLLLELLTERFRFGIWGCLKKRSTAFCTILTKFVCSSGALIQRTFWPRAPMTTIFTCGTKRNVAPSRPGQITRTGLQSWYSRICTMAVLLRTFNGFQILRASSSAWCLHHSRQICNSKSGKWIRNLDLRK